MFHHRSRREFVQGTGLAIASWLSTRAVRGDDAAAEQPPVAAAEAAVCPHPLLTPVDDYYTVARGNPKPHTLTGDALSAARMTPETWRLEVTADPFTEPPGIKLAAEIGRALTIDAGTALDLPTLLELGRTRNVQFIKAIQCLNIPTPLGQGLWEGVPLRDVLQLCGPLQNVRRIYYRGYHNHDPAQVFQSSLSYTQVMEAAPGEFPPFLAYRLNGQPIPPVRGGPVRMIVPWAHGFKSIKWLQQIFLTNDYRANDTYALQNNDPESFLKTAAYTDEPPKPAAAGTPLTITGHVISGLSGLTRVEGWLRVVTEESPTLTDDAEGLQRGPWQPCELLSPPDWQAILPDGVDPRSLLGFDHSTGRPLTWPLQYGMASWRLVLRDLAPGRYEFRARAVDANGFAQPEPRPQQKSGKNALQVRVIEVV